MLADAMAYLPNDILVKVDRAAMAASLETQPLGPSGCSLAVALALKIRDGAGNGPCANCSTATCPGTRSSALKQGLPPIGPWLRGPSRAWADDLLDPALIAAKAGSSLSQCNALGVHSWVQTTLPSSGVC